MEFSIDTEIHAIIEKILPRKQLLARPDLLVKNKIQVIAANLDQFIIISSAKEPRFKPGLVDRFLVSAENETLEAIIVINKIDLIHADSFKLYADAWNSLGYKTIFTSAKTGEGLDKLKSLLNGKTSVFAGHSGVGKSSLLNAIQPQLNLVTRNISKSSGRGVHTTTSVIMYPLDSNSWVVDTPGLKVFGLSGINRENLYRYFPEMTKIDGNCKFNDCIHISEPGCAIKKAIETGGISQFRYDSYKRIWEKLNSQYDL